MTHWIWQDEKWPNFRWNAGKVQAQLSEARILQGKLLGIVESFNEQTREQMNLRALTDEMITTSAIEGSIIDRDSVRSSIYHRLGIDKAGIKGNPDRYVEGLLDIMLDAAENHDQPLSLERLCQWHAALFPTGYSGMHKILVGQLRGEGEMKIISGRGNKQITHYIAPPHEKLKEEIEKFLHWFNEESRNRDKIDGIIRSAIAHLWFERIHPFDDGNGRIGRPIIDMVLAQDEKLSTRFYSISSAIMEDRKSYYQALDKVTTGSMDVTVWVEWFIKCFIKAIEMTFENIETALQKSKYWQLHSASEINERQQKVLNKMLDKGPGNYIGGITTRKYVNITKISRATAYRELADLVAKKYLKPINEKGRSAGYEILWPTNGN